MQFIDAKENYRCMNCNRSVSISCFINFLLGFSGNFLLLSNFLAENFGRAQNLNGCFVLQYIALKIRLFLEIRFNILQLTLFRIKKEIVEMFLVCPIAIVGFFGPGSLVGLGDLAGSIGLVSLVGSVGMEGLGYLDDPESQEGRES